MKTIALLASLVVIVLSCENNDKSEIDEKIEWSMKLSRELDTTLNCAWSNKYNLCICAYSSPGYNTFSMIVVPNNRCGHD